MLYTQDQRDRLSEQVDKLTSLPQPSSPPPALPLGTIALFADASWTSAVRVDLETKDYPAKLRHRLAANINDNVAWVAWNLPLGVVATFMDAETSQATNPADLMCAMGTFDLVGSGVTRGAALASVNMTDKATMFLWREVDLWLGAIEFFEHVDFAGACSTVFLSEWPRNTLIDCHDWAIVNGVSSVRWKSLTDRQSAVLYANADGSGTPANNYDGIKGWVATKEVARFPDFSFNDSATGFIWKCAEPMKEVVDSIRLHSTPNASSTDFNAPILRGTNLTPAGTVIKLGLKQTAAESLLVETTDRSHAGMTGVTSHTFTKKTAGGLTYAVTSLALSFTHGNTGLPTGSCADTITADLDLADSVTLTNTCNSYQATYSATVATSSATEYNPKVTRWYDYPIAGGVRDPKNNDWYKVEETILVTVTGTWLYKTVSYVYTR